MANSEWTIINSMELASKTSLLALKSNFFLSWDKWVNWSSVNNSIRRKRVVVYTRWSSYRTANSLENYEIKKYLQRAVQQQTSFPANFCLNSHRFRNLCWYRWVLQLDEPIDKFGAPLKAFKAWQVFHKRNTWKYSLRLLLALNLERRVEQHIC